MPYTDDKNIKVEKSGFVRKYDFSHIYKEVDNDIDELIEEGHLFEFKFDDLCAEIKAKKELDQRGDKPRDPTLLYPVNMPDNLNEN